MSFCMGFTKIASLPKWLHESHKAIAKNKMAQHSSKGLHGLMKYRGIAK